MFAVCVRMRIRPECHEAFLPLIARNAAESRAVEPGCAQFDIWTDPNRPGEIFLYELYSDEAAFAAHLQSPHFRQFDEATEDMLSEKSVSTYRTAIL